MKAYWDRAPHGDGPHWFSAAWIANRFDVPVWLVDQSALTDDQIYRDPWL